MNRVRPAILADAAAIGRIEVESWRTSYAGILPDALLVGLKSGERQRIWARTIARQPDDVAVGTDASGRVQGFATCGTAREATGRFAGEVFTLYVAPDYQGNGLGRDLLLAMFTRLRRRGFESALVWVLRDNPARFFYEHLGGKLVSHRPLPIGTVTVPARAYGWPDLAAVLRTQARTGGRLDGQG
jgi:ribosomal protein S18 acetylase RimI-like enzyme